MKQELVLTTKPTSLALSFFAICELNFMDLTFLEHFPYFQQSL